MQQIKRGLKQYLLLFGGINDQVCMSDVTREDRLSASGNNSSGSDTRLRTFFTF